MQEVFTLKITISCSCEQWIILEAFWLIYFISDSMMVNKYSVGSRDELKHEYKPRVGLKEFWCFVPCLIQKDFFTAELPSGVPSWTGYDSGRDKEICLIVTWIHVTKPWFRVTSIEVPRDKFPGSTEQVPWSPWLQSFLIITLIFQMLISFVDLAVHSTANYIVVLVGHQLDMFWGRTCGTNLAWRNGLSGAE